MYVIPVNGIVEVSMTGFFDGQEFINTFYYRNSGAEITDGQSAMIELATLFDAEFVANAVNAMSTAANNIGVKVQYIYPTRYQYFFYDSLTPSGVYPDAGLPSGVAVVLQRTGDKAGPKYRGRIFMTAVPTVYVEESIVVPVASGVYHGIAAHMKTVLTLAGPGIWTPVIYNLKVPLTFTDITMTGVNPNVRYQRRREVGRGI